MKVKEIIILGIVIVILVLGVLVISNKTNNPLLGSTAIEGTYSYKASAGSNQVILNTKGILHRILVGADVALATIQLLDTATPVDANTTVWQITGDTLSSSSGGAIDIGIYFEKGITATLSGQTNTTFIFSPR